MNKSAKEKPEKLKVKDIPFEKIVEGFLEVKPNDGKKQKKNKKLNESPRCKQAGYQSGKGFFNIGKTRRFSPPPPSFCLPHRKRMGY